jgi:PTH1 family peptidyl-tRNA hydrolase
VLGRRRRSSYSSGRDVQWLVAGLGNPGPEYDGSPHNIGFDAVHELARRHRISLVAKHGGMYGEGSIGDVDVALLTPLTFMNLSGQSIKPALRQLGLEPEQLLVVHDEIDLDFARLQVRLGGGLAGHNGLKSINESLGTREFARVRVGVGRPDPDDHRPIADWILKPMPADRDRIGLAAAAADAVEVVVEHSIRTAANRLKKAAAQQEPEP